MANSICVNVVMLTMDDTHAGDVQGNTQHSCVLVLHVSVLLCTLRLSLVLRTSAASSFAVAQVLPKGQWFHRNLQPLQTLALTGDVT